MSNLRLTLAAFCLSAAPALAQAPCHAEYDGNNFSDNVSMGGPGLLLAILFVAPSDISVTRMEVFTGEGAGTNTLGIWSDAPSHNEPLASLGFGSWNMTNANGWQGVNLPAPINLIGGTPYWVAWGPINGSQASVDTSLPGLGQRYNASFNGGPWIGPFQDNSHWKFRLFGNCTPPTVYCLAKTNSLGCVPAIGWTGASSAAASSGFVVQGTNVRNQKSGLLFYGTTGPNSAPFQGGTLCVASPIKRTPATSSGGTALPANDCTGVYAIDMNCFAASACGGAPLPALKTPGTVVDCQWWGRDPGFPAPNNTTLTNGLEYTVGP
jgi:hypothetical protein